jgi:hypothetical protein
MHVACVVVFTVRFYGWQQFREFILLHDLSLWNPAWLLEWCTLNQMGMFCKFFRRAKQQMPLIWEWCKRYNSAFDVIHPLIWICDERIPRALPCILLLRVDPATGCSNIFVPVFLVSLSVDRPSSFAVGSAKTSFELIRVLFDLWGRLGLQNTINIGQVRTAHHFILSTLHNFCSITNLSWKQDERRENYKAITADPYDKMEQQGRLLNQREIPSERRFAHSNNHVTNVGPRVSPTQHAD